VLPTSNGYNGGVGVGGETHTSKDGLKGVAKRSSKSSIARPTSTSLHTP